MRLIAATGPAIAHARKLGFIGFMRDSRVERVEKTGKDELNAVVWPFPWLMIIVNASGPRVGLDFQYSRSAGFDLRDCPTNPADMLHVVFPDVSDLGIKINTVGRVFDEIVHKAMRGVS